MKKLIKSNILIILILVFALILYTYFMLHNTLSPDEAMYAWNAKQLYENPSLIFSEQMWGITPPMFYIIVAVFDIFLPQEFAARLVPVLFALSGIFLIYLLGKEIKNKKLGLLAALFLTLNPWFWMISNRILLDVPLTTLAILNSYFLIKLYKTKENKFLALSIISFILIILTKSVGIMFLPLNIIIIFYVYFRNKIKNPLKYIIPILLTIVFTLFLFWSQISKYIKYLSLDKIKSNYLIINNIFDVLFGYVPSQLYLLLYLAAIVFFIALIYLIIKSNQRFVYYFLLLWIASVFIFRLFFGSSDIVRYVLPALPALLLLILLVLYELLTKIEIKYIYIILLIAIISIPLLLQGAQINKFTSYSKTGFREAGTWLKENVDPDNSIIYAGSPFQTQYYSGFECAEENKILLCYGDRPTGIPLYAKYVLNETDKTIYLQMNFREKYQPPWITNLHNAPVLISMGFKLEKAIYKKQPFYITPPTQAKTEFFEFLNITPYTIYEGENIIFPPRIEAYSGYSYDTTYLEELGFKKASSLSDYIKFAITLEDTYVDQPVILIFKKDPDFTTHTDES